ncbi:MAG: DsbA family protein [Geminicoccaceae bacterium]
MAAGATWFAVDAAAQQRAPVSGTSERPVELDEFEQRVRDFLLEHPQVIMDALQVLQERQRAAEADDIKRTIAARRDEIFNDPNAPVGGHPAGDATVVEFFDYNCPYCRRVAPTLTEVEEADANLRVLYKEFPILGAGSRFAARAALAAHKQGKYLPFHTALMQAQEQLDELNVMKIAQAVGLDAERLRQDMQDAAIGEAIARNLQLAEALGITGTPSFVIGDQIVPGAVGRSRLERLIAEARDRGT